MKAKNCAYSPVTRSCWICGKMRVVGRYSFGQSKFKWPTQRRSWYDMCRPCWNEVVVTITEALPRAMPNQYNLMFEKLNKEQQYHLISCAMDIVRYKKWCNDRDCISVLCDDPTIELKMP